MAPRLRWRGVMMRHVRQSVLIAATLALASAAFGADAAEKCEASKLKLAGKYAFCRAKADSKAVKTASAPDYSKCDAKLSAGWAAAEMTGAGDCPTSGDLQPRQAELTAQSDRMLWRLSADARFVDNADGTISDRQTGLMWEKKFGRDFQANPANPHDADNNVVWSGYCATSNAP
jgi:hypothetical protein